MANTIELKQQIAQGVYDDAFRKLYGSDEKIVAAQRARYTELIDRFADAFGAERTVRLYSAPGRTEIGGNHTDHNNGVVLAGSVNLDIVAVVSPNSDNIVRVKSHGFEKIDDVDLSIRTPQPKEAEHSASLIRGVAAGIQTPGRRFCGVGSDGKRQVRAVFFQRGAIVFHFDNGAERHAVRSAPHNRQNGGEQAEIAVTYERPVRRILCFFYSADLLIKV